MRHAQSLFIMEYDYRLCDLQFNLTHHHILLPLTQCLAAVVSIMIVATSNVSTLGPD